MKMGGDPFAFAGHRQEQERKASKIGKHDGEKLICRSAYFPKDIKTFGGTEFKAGEKLAIVEFVNGGSYQRYVLMATRDRRIECERKAFRLVPKNHAFRKWELRR